uniref:Secreted protein n=1 Tax=Thraustotheca clavata TaxID=74557 RepID=A0A0A7CLT3_9STRA|nr:secreted protein [Thraustotheca clavata]
MRSCFLLCMISFVMAKPQYVARLPNGANVPNVPALGHTDPTGGDASVNAFGEDFHSNGKAWSTTFCQLDSDGDGATNGEELLDPCCTWKVGAKLSSTGTPTDPGVKNTFTATQLAALKCSSSSSTNSSSTVTSTTTSTSTPSSTTVKVSSSASFSSGALLALPLVAVALL